MKKLLLAAAAPLLITSHGVALAKSTNTLGDSKIQAARDAGNGGLRLAQLGTFAEDHDGMGLMVTVVRPTACPQAKRRRPISVARGSQRELRLSVGGGVMRGRGLVTVFWEVKTRHVGR